MHAWIGLDQKNELHRAFGISAIPKAIVINSEGKLVKVLHPVQLNARLISQIHGGG